MHTRQFKALDPTEVLLPGLRPCYGFFCFSCISTRINKPENNDPELLDEEGEMEQVRQLL
jgi:hypothetical protein